MPGNYVGNKKDAAFYENLKNGRGFAILNTYFWKLCKN